MSTVASSKKIWKEVVQSTKNGPAKFLPNTDIDKLTREAWDNGVKVSNGKPWKVYKGDDVIGASAGTETNYMRVELTESTGELYASPITQQQFNKLTKDQ